MSNFGKNETVPDTHSAKAGDEAPDVSALESGQVRLPSMCQDFDAAHDLLITKRNLAELITNGEDIYGRIRTLLPQLVVEAPVATLQIGAAAFEVRLKRKVDRFVLTIPLTDKDALISALRDGGFAVSKEDRLSRYRANLFDPAVVEAFSAHLSSNESRSLQMPGQAERGGTHVIEVSGKRLILRAQWDVDNQKWVWAYAKSYPFFKEMKRLLAEQARLASGRLPDTPRTELKGFEFGQRQLARQTGSEILAGLLAKLSSEILAGGVTLPLLVPSEIHADAPGVVNVKIIISKGERRVAYAKADLQTLGDARFLRQFLPSDIFPLSAYAFEKAAGLSLASFKGQVDFPKRFYPALHSILGEVPLDGNYTERLIQIGQRSIRVFVAICGSQPRWCASQQDLEYLCSRRGQRSIGIPAAIPFSERHMVRWSASALREALGLTFTPEAAPLQQAAPEEGMIGYVGNQLFPVFWTKDTSNGSLVAAVWNRHLNRVGTWISRASTEAQRTESSDIAMSQRLRSLPSYIVGCKRIDKGAIHRDFIALESADNPKAIELARLARRFFREIVSVTEGIPPDRVYRIKLPGRNIYFSGVVFKGSQEFGIASQDLDRVTNEVAKLVPYSDRFEVPNPVTLTLDSLPAKIFQKRSFLSRLSAAAARCPDNQFVAVLELEGGRALSLYRAQDTGKAVEWVVSKDDLTLLETPELAGRIGARHLTPFDEEEHIEFSSIFFDSGVIAYGRRKYQELSKILGPVSVSADTADIRVVAGVRFFRALTDNGRIRWAFNRGDLETINAEPFEREIFRGQIRRLIPEQFTFLGKVTTRDLFRNGSDVLPKIFQSLPAIKDTGQTLSVNIPVFGKQVKLEVMQLNGNFGWAIPNTELVGFMKEYGLEPLNPAFWSYLGEGDPRGFLREIAEDSELFDLAVSLNEDKPSS
jgi:hypothetical protein